MMDFVKIEEQRLACGITQRALCTLAGIHYTTYTRIKLGHKMPNLRTIQKLQKALAQVEVKNATLD